MYVYHCFTLALVLQETRDWNTEDNIAFRTLVTTKITKQINFTPHVLRNIETHTRVELISLIFLPQFSLAFWQSKDVPFPLVLEISLYPHYSRYLAPINEKKANPCSHNPRLFQTNSGLRHFAPQRVLEDSVMGSWFISSQYMHTAVVTCPSLNSCTPVFGVWIRGKGWERKCVGEQKKALFHSSCQSWTTEPVRQQTPTASKRNTTCATKQNFRVVFNTTILIRLLCLDFSNGSTYYLENNMEYGLWHWSIVSKLRGDYVA